MASPHAIDYARRKVLAMFDRNSLLVFADEAGVRNPNFMATGDLRELIY